MEGLEIPLSLNEEDLRLIELKLAQLEDDVYKMAESMALSMGQIDEYKDIIIDENDALAITDKNTLLIVVDTHKNNYVEVPELLEETNKIVVIDHHRKSPDFIENTIKMIKEKNHV